MKRKICFFTCCIMIVVSVISTGCKKDNEVIKKQPKPSYETEASSPEVVATEEVPAINMEKLENLKGIPLTAQNLAHGIYKGMFGQEEVIVALYIDKEAKEAQISLVGAYHSDKLTFSCELLEDGVRYQKDQYYILLKQQKDDVMTGYFYEKGSQMQDVSIKLEAINYTENKDKLYSIGSNEEVETFAQKVLDSINGYDFESFSNYVDFPIRVRVNQALQTIETKEGFRALGADVIFTDGFVQSMAVAYPNIMFSNATDGVMLGDGMYNVWIQLDANGELKVVKINN